MKFRPGAWRERFCLETVVTVKSAAARAPVPNQEIKRAGNAVALRAGRDDKGLYTVWTQGG